MEKQRLHINLFENECSLTLTTIEEINNINNLIGLCPNHHWEYDNGLLEL